MSSRSLGKMFGTITNSVEVEEPTLKEMGLPTKFTERHGGFEATIDLSRRVLVWIFEAEREGLAPNEVIDYLKKMVQKTMKTSMRELRIWSKKDDG